MIQLHFQSKSLDFQTRDSGGTKEKRNNNTLIQSLHKHPSKQLSKFWAISLKNITCRIRVTQNSTQANPVNLPHLESSAIEQLK